MIQFGLHINALQKQPLTQSPQNPPQKTINQSRRVSGDVLFCDKKSAHLIAIAKQLGPLTGAFHRFYSISACSRSVAKCYLTGKKTSPFLILLDMCSY